MKDGPAFPGRQPASPVAFGIEGYQPGMSLRDWFAGKALAMVTPDTPDGKASEAYAVADAMLRAREGGCR